MAWLRLDDGFTKHPKFEGWTPAQRWAWLEAMEYCARYRTGGRIPADHSLLPRAVSAAILKRAEACGWLHKDDEGDLWINDWELYNPARAEDLEAAVQAAMNDRPAASANEIVRVVGGNRKQTLSIIRRFQGGSESGSEVLVPEPVPAPVTRAPAHAFPSRPVPRTTTPAAALTPQDPPNTAAAELIRKLDDLGLNGGALGLALAEPDRAQAWLDLAATEADRNPAAFVLTGLRSGAWPSTRGPIKRTSPTDPPCNDCGLGGGNHTTDCKTLTARLERAQNAALDGADGVSGSRTRAQESDREADE